MHLEDLAEKMITRYFPRG